MISRIESGALPLLMTVAVLFSFPDAGQGQSAEVGPPALTDLRVVLDTGVVIQDRNGDEVVDFLHVRILISGNPSEADLVAGANLAARFGFETSATDLGLVGEASAAGSYDVPVILVGAGAVDATGALDGSQRLRAELAPGQGLIAHVPPGGRFGAGAVAVVGYDATGLLAAAAYLAGRYPAVWSPDGTSWQEVAEKVEAFGEDRGWAGTEVFLDRIVVDGAHAGLARARVTVRVMESGVFQEAVTAFLGQDTLSSDSVAAEGGDPRADPEAANPDVVEDPPVTADPAVAADTAAAPNTAEDTAADTAADTAQTGPDPESEPGEGSDKPTDLSDLEFRNLHRLDVHITGPGESRTVTLRPGDPWETREDGSFRAGSDATFSLPSLYQVGGLYRDTNRDLVPDETAAYLSVSGAGAPGAVMDFATRIGLETAGIRLPLARVEAQEDDPTAWGFPVFMGTDHYQIRRLQEEGELPATQMASSEGFVQFVENAFGERNAMAVGGADDAGLNAITDWLARRAPYLWRYGKGEYRLADAETEVRRFLQAREGPGQVSLALTKLGSWMDRMAEEPLERIQVELAALEAPEGLADLMEAIVRERFPDAEVEVQNWSTGFGVGDTVFVQEWDLPWEVDEARDILERDVYPNVRAGTPLTLELRVSEPPEIRTALRDEILERLQGEGVTGSTVHVLSAYKQGYSWIYDVLLPRLRDQGVASIDLTYHTLEESEEIRWQTVAAETRWLQEVYPFDAVLARELGISDTAVVFHPTRQKDPIYTFEAKDASGAVILKESFDPKYVVRPFFDLFPEYEQVRVTTGWISATSGGETLVDQRIVTDPERFWDRLQTETFSEVIAYIMDSQDGNPSGDNAPFFDAFQVDLRLSEPDYRIGIDEETISSLEALHEDIFFETHTLFNLIAGRYQTSLSYPGRVLPFVDPTGAGEPGHARLVLTGKERGNPELVIRTWRAGDPEPIYQAYELTPLPTEAPKLAGAVAVADTEGLKQLLVRVTVPDSADRFEEFEDRSGEAGIDRQFLSVELLEGMLASLERLHEAGIMEDELSWDRVAELALDFRLEKDSAYQRTALLPRSRNPSSTDNPRLAANGWKYEGQSMVQWDTPMPPEESDEILARLGTFPEVTPYFLANSYLGRPVWAADFLPPHEAEFVSQAKLNALRPTIFISGREHANEVSSTNHILRLGELLVTDSTFRRLLDRVNVVLQPVTNADGAALAYERQLVNPDHMIHAARPGALGVDATSGGGSDDPIYPEAKARTMIREAWLPDVYVNPHGYPSHEWVQYFAGYSAWVRGRRVGPRDWWVPRGWFLPGFSWVEDEENPDYQTAQFALLDSMAAAMTALPEVDDANRRMYARYKKYGEQDWDGFNEYHHNGMAVSMRLRGSESIGSGVNSARITYIGITSEAPDEIARGDWLQLMGKMGLAHTSVAIRYLATGEYEVEREAEAFDGAVVRKLFRVKPVLPGKSKDDPPEGGVSDF